MQARAAVLTAFSMPFAFTDVAMRAPGPHQLLVRTTAAPFCSTDVMGWRGMRRKAPPVILGHTAVGVVEAVGADIADLRAGDRVVVSATPHCGSCFYCTIGRPDQCTVLLDGSDPVVADLADGRPVRAAGRVGAYAQMMRVDRIQVHPLPAGLTDEVACLLGCGVTTGLGAVFTIADVQPGQSVAVVGLGHLGLWAVQGARLAGAERILALDPDPRRRALATALGATDTIDPADTDPVDAVRSRTEGRGADVVIEAAGPARAARQAVRMARRAGTIVLTGVDHADTDLVIPQLDVTVHGKRVVGCQNGQITPAADLARWAELLRRGDLDAGPIVTGHYGLDELDTVLRHSLSGADVTGVLVEF